MVDILKDDKNKLNPILSKFVDIKCEPNSSPTKKEELCEPKPKKPAISSTESPNKDASKSVQKTNSAPNSLIPSRDQTKKTNKETRVSSKPKSDVDFSKKKIANQGSDESAKLLRPSKEKRKILDPHMRLEQRRKGRLNIYKLFNMY